MSELVKPKVVPALDKDFCPAVLTNHAFVERVKKSGEGVPLTLTLERENGLISVFRTQVFNPQYERSSENLLYVERLVKTLLWLRGGVKIIIGGPKEIGLYVKNAYTRSGVRDFDAKFMAGVYGKEFTVEVASAKEIATSDEKAFSFGFHLEGCRIGFDLGASDKKVAAVVDGEVVFSEEVEWDPRNQSNPKYHYDEIMDSLHRAAKHLPRVDAIGGSSAGIYIDNQVRVASLFRGVPKEIFEEEVRNIFLRIKEVWGVPFEIINDGDVTALAGAMSLNAKNVLGIALGSSEAGGYVNKERKITGWLNELAFAPVDFNPQAPVDEWSGDSGCGVQYFSQEAVFRLAKKANIEIPAELSKAGKLKFVQDLLNEGNTQARLIFETIGCYLGYGIAHYADFYEVEHILILGRVTSGAGGVIIREKVNQVLKEEFPALNDRIRIHLPEKDSDRRIGQAIAAASLPSLK